MARLDAAPGEITAVLGPTNTGKTHLALTRMMARASGVIGLPLRLLAREIYDKVVKVKGERAVALVTGEEKIVPANARYFVCTVEAMPMDMRPAFVAIDEIQLCADPERGHIFTDRLLHARGSEETMFLGAATMAPMIRRLVPEARIDYRERFSELSYAGAKKLGKLPRRSAIVAFSAEDVYSIAELIRRQRGGAAVVMGALSPRTRNAQVELYQSGEVDYLIATDAIGMGLNMDVDHVAFASYTKFDGRRRRRLHPHEIGQIAGRAGRFRSDGTFGETADARPLDPEIVEKVVNHDFDPVTRLTWRNTDLDLSNLEALRNSLNRPTPDPALQRVETASDEQVLEILARDPDIRERVRSQRTLARLWDVCRMPDFRKVTIDEHARLVGRVFHYLTSAEGHLPDSWLEAQLERVAKTHGDVDALSQRLAHVRTWSYAANRPDWTRDSEYWRARTREVEDQLSDALHERLMGRFIDKRTSALMKGLREKDSLQSGLDHTGEVTVEGHYVGRLTGLSFRPDHSGGPLAQRAVAQAAIRAVRPEVNRRLGALVRAGDETLCLCEAGTIEWQGEPVGRLAPSSDVYAPAVTLIGGELGAGEAQARAERRLERFAAREAESVLAPLLALRREIGADGAIQGLARGIAYRLVEGSGAVARSALAADIEQLSVKERRQLRKAGVRIGEHAVFLPALVKPRPARLSSLLKAVARGRPEDALIAAPGRMSIPVEPERGAADYAAAGFQPCGEIAVRLDILERLADLIREARSGHDRHHFAITHAMTSLLGCSVEELRGVLRSLGYKRVQKGADPAKAEGELWGGRAKARTRARTAPQAPAPVPDNPFAKLAELDLDRPAPAGRAVKPRTPKTAAKPRHAHGGGPAGEAGAAPSGAPAGQAKPSRRRRRGRGAKAKPA
ncbi:ATP-dependent DNA helicase [Marinicauda algicola]|uniref:ATP-dependent DNA helicase n=1 Tax=Marinicauda algicola TaxID=2029849 RepID=A0A4S2H3D4_9PROT|nr:helicase-related protein [Marinicauda algicola]TGY90125.1 ATP-dependent DNA helicase [Marinicauda algicola]